MTTVGIILDRQHFGKPEQDDMGASFDISADGSVKLWETEAARTSIIAHFVAIEAAKRQVVCSTLLYGNYGDRQRDAHSIADANPATNFKYLALHLNAGKKAAPYYGLVGYDSRSAGGKYLATRLAEKWSAVGIVKDCRTMAVAADSPDSYQRNVFATIARVFEGPNNICGCCLELCFLEDRAANNVESFRKMAKAIVDACLATTS